MMRSRLLCLMVGLILAACGRSGDDRSSPEREDENGAASRIFDMPYLMRELDNGLRVIIVKTDYPDIVTLQIPVQTGSRNEVEAGKSGFAHFFEHMMFRGTDKYPADVFSAIRKKAGANSSAFTNDDFTNFYVTFTKPDLEKMIEIEADRFQNLAYSEADFRTEALAVKGEYLKNYSDPLQKAYERTRALAYRVHPYSHTTMGFIEDIEAMPDQIDYSREFFDRWYRPEYASVIIVGDVDPEGTLALVQKYWSGWQRGDYVAEIPAEPAPTNPVYEHIAWQGETQPWLFIGFRSPPFDPGQKDFPAMTVLDSIYFSESSDLYQKLVIEDQSVDQLLTDFPLNKDPNVNLIYIRVADESRAEDVEAAVLETLARARTELIDERKLAQTKSRLRYSFAGSLDNAQSIGNMLAQFVQYERTPETVNQMYATADALDAEDIRRMANRYFTDAGRVTVTLSNSPGIAGVGRNLSLDDLVANRESAGAPAESVIESADTAKEEVFEPRGEPVPLQFVARQSATSPLVDISIVVHVGAAMDPPGKKGLATLTAAMITDGGSATFSIEDINDAMYPIASDFNAQVDKEMTRLSGQVHKDNLDTWYRYVRSQLLNPGWRQKDFDRVRAQLVNAIRTGLVGNNDEELGKEMLYSAIYGPQHPYGSLNLGNSSDVAALTLEDVQAFYARYYVINNMTVGLSGGYPDSFPARISDDMQSRPAGERASIVVPAAPAVAASSATIVQKETPAVAVSLGFPIDLKRGDPDWLALWLVRSWLGEHRSEASHLYERIRTQRGMNYGDYAYIEYFPSGMFTRRPDTNLGRQQQIFQVWIRPLRNNNDAQFATRTAMFELDKLIEDGMTETDFEATRQFLTKSVSLLMDGQSRQLGYALDSQYYEIGDFAEYVRSGLEHLTLADVNRVVRENLRTGKVHYVFVTADADDLRDRLAANRPSPVTYGADMPQELLDEDRLIESRALGIDEDHIDVVPAENVFK